MGKKKKIIIEGVTNEGQVFRPSDWTERLSGSLCTFSKRRMVYSPLLQPTEREGNRCVIIDPELAQTNPALYQTIMEFARANQLKMHDEEDPDVASNQKDDKSQ